MRPRPMSRHWTDDESREHCANPLGRGYCEAATPIWEFSNFQGQAAVAGKKHVPRSAPVKPDPQDFDAVKRDYARTTASIWSLSLQDLRTTTSLPRHCF